MPPLARYWFIYFVVGVIVVALSASAYLLFTAPFLTSEAGTRVAVLLLGVAVAGLAIVANTWSQWWTATVAHAMDALQTLRTDREYLINANVVSGRVRRWDRPFPAHLASEFSVTNRPSSVDAPSFRTASLFLLNQYEFLAAGVRAGAIDYRLVRTTLRGVILGFVIVYAVQIAELRRGQPRAFDNLLWLYRRFRGMVPFDRGPVP